MKTKLTFYKPTRMASVIAANADAGTDMKDLLCTDAAALVTQRIDDGGAEAYNAKSIHVQGTLSADISVVQPGEWVVLYFNDESSIVATVRVFTTD